MKSLAAFSFVALAASVGAILCSRPAEPQDKQQAAGHDRINTLLVERRDTLQKLVDALTNRYTPRSEAIRARSLLLDAELVLVKTKAERIRIHEKRVENSRDLEKRMKAMVAHGSGIGPRNRGATDEMFRTKAARLEAEIDLLREQGAGHERINTLLVERRDALRQLLDAVTVMREAGLGVYHGEEKQLLDAELDLAKTKAERIRIYEKHVKNLHDWENRMKVQARFRGVEAMLRLAARLRAEIDLLREQGAGHERINTLLVERRDALRQLLDAVTVMREAGSGVYHGAEKQLLDAELDLAKTKAERIRIYEKHVKNLHDWENRMKVQARFRGVEAMLRFKAARLRAEIGLLREQGAAD